ncbi:MAG: pentapeptide repeat-containing protein, partial [Wolbachia sp.]
MIRFLILILVGHLCYGNETNDEKNQISDFLNALRDAKYVSYSKKDFAEFLVQCHKEGVPEDFKKGFGSNLNGANFNQLYLSKSVFDGVSLIGADFSNTDLSDVSFINVDLRGANFSNANLHGIKIKGTNLSFTKFVSANLTDIVFDQSNVSYADF